MTMDRDVERLLDRWFDDGPTEIADAALTSALDTIDHTAQDRPILGRPRRTTLGRFLRLAALPTAAVVVVALAASVLPRPTPSANASSSPGPTVSSSSPGTSSPPATTDRGLIAFVRQDPLPGGPPTNFATRPWIVKPDGSGLRVLNADLRVDPRWISWAADGSWVVVLVGPDLTRVDVGTGVSTVMGAGCHQPCDFDSQPSGTADGSTIAFVRSIGVVNDPTPDTLIATIDTATGRVTELEATRLSGSSDACAPLDPPCAASTNDGPSLSSDGRRLAYTRISRTVTSGPTNPDGHPTIHGDLVVANFDGTNPQVVDVGGLSARDPIWSADGTRLVFSSYVEDYIDDGTSGAFDTLRTRRDVYTVAIDGSDLRQLTGDGKSTAAQWTADGAVRFLRVAGDEATDTVHPNYWRINADGSGLQQITFLNRDMWGRSVTLEYPDASWHSLP